MASGVWPGPKGREFRLKKIIIDTDPGIDDLAALLLALASPEVDPVAITTVYGNASVDTCTANVLQFLAAAGRSDIPVYRGSGKPLLRPANEGWASHIHGSDGLGGFALDDGASHFQDRPERREAGAAASPLVRGKHAALTMVDTALASPGEVAVIALGRLTNVALALALEPSLAEAVSEIVVMGGAITVPGNVSPVATANLHEDPEAAAMVYGSGAPIVQVGLDVCNKVTISPAQLEALAHSSNPATQLLVEATASLREAYIRTGRIGPEEGVRYNDLPAMAYAVDPALFTCRPALVHIETSSYLTRGQTVADWDAGRPNAKVCLEVEADALASLFTERVSG